MCKNCLGCSKTLTARATASGLISIDTKELDGLQVNSMSVRASGANTLKSVDGETLVSDNQINATHIKIVSSDGKTFWDWRPLSTVQEKPGCCGPICVEGLPDLGYTKAVTLKTDTTVAGYATTQVFEVTFGYVCPTNC